jgi:anti-anti-sigma factor
MPIMDGMAVLQRIKEINPLAEVIVVTGHGDMDLAIKAQHLDATDFITKPIQRTILETAQERAHARRRLGREQAETITLERCGEAAVVHIHGAVNARSEARLQALFREAQGLGLPRIVLHFGDGATVNGAGIAVLTQLLQAGRREGCGVVAAGVSANLAKVFDIVGLAGQLPLFATLEEALP